MTSRQNLTLGLLPEKKLDWRKFVLSYGIVAVLVLILLVSHLIWPDRMGIWANYTVTEIIPRPDLVPEKPIIKKQPKITKLLPAVKFETPKLIVPRDVRQPKPVEAEVVPPKIQPVNFEAPKNHAGSRRHAGAGDPHRRFWKFSDTNRKCADSKGADWRVRRPQWPAGRRQARREADGSQAGIV